MPAEPQGGADPEHAVAAAQTQVDEWRNAVFGADADAVHPLWLRAFLFAHPEALLGDPELARAQAHKFGDPRTGATPARTRFQDQTLRPARVPSWVKGALAPALLTLAVCGTLLSALARDGIAFVELAWVALFGFLFGLSAVGLCTAAIGFVVLRRRKPEALPQVGAIAPLPRSALVMPIYHESAERVFAAIAAMRESLAATPGGDAFEIFVLSDSRDPACAAAEERALRRISAIDDGPIPVYYRRRPRNDRNKAGNLAEFFERWGDRYTYAVVLDADSMMRGDTVVELVRRMERMPRVALLQAPLALHRGKTLFARAQQFAAGVHGPVFSRGLAAWAGPHGNYYGHNAVVRVRAFLDCCALPLLAGDPPLGGHMLSHDFVEAALLCRAGWEVRMADDLGGSWEELPASLPEYVTRDRRWCQGNLQHLRVVRAEGLQPMSRIHMLLGAAHYLAGGAWLCFMALTLWLAGSGGTLSIAREIAIGVAAATAVVLLGPKLLGTIAHVRAGVPGYGGAGRVVLGVALETVLAALLAPLLMLHHARIVGSILLGSAVRWESQRARPRGTSAAIARAELPATLLGAALAGWLLVHSPALLAWLSPVWVPWLLAVPIALLASSRTAGALAARLGLFTVPSESSPDDLALRAEELRPLTMGDGAARFRDLVLDPVLLAAHLAQLDAAAGARRGPAAAEALLRLRERALRSGPAALSAAEREQLAADAETMRWLHRHAWRSWPVESWQLGRNRPQLPS
jgi:membrane glycosyltransferase